ncbi:PDDEXK nuclease domain-containing protein [Flavobacterium sp.]|uniref:PDDEXK nuclease domain-containing protein n=1 Tax=Flavobacterium sp. TaxID=239 RepID=UPI002B9B8507|nr:PDDEXK nuclease domain-containing protein [Flavobacterium sp.]HSD08902.1 PDDEXK nuclease domain-containing protein [Flavobacterium sp.]
MSEVNLFDLEYKKWISELKTKIRSTQIKAAIAVNTALIHFYWDLGKMISEKQTAYGTSFLEQVSKDLKGEFPEMNGFSVTNLRYCKLFYNYLANHPQIGDESDIVNHPQLGDDLKENLIFQLPWGHIKLLIDKIKNTAESNFYIQESIANNWSRDVLALQIKTDLYKRQGGAITNFAHTLPNPFSDLAQQTLKDPYVFDFMTMSKPFQEKDIEKQLVAHITKFLLELGKGFAFVGQQFHIEIAENDYYIDLLFYHIKLKCYVVIELKNTKFIPEYAGKLNFYLSAVDSMIKQEEDKPTIGILLCRDKNNIEAEFALRDINKPMGISEFQFTEILPDNLKSSLPTIEEIESELKNLEE